MAAALGVDAADVLAIGDGRNDIELLHWAGRGVAMGQAVEEVIAAADHTTGTVYDDGAATEISRWFPAPHPDPAESPSPPELAMRHAETAGWVSHDRGHPASRPSRVAG